MEDIIKEQFGFLANDIETSIISFSIVTKINQFLKDNPDIHSRYSNDDFLIYTDRAHKISTVIALGKIYDLDDRATTLHSMASWTNENQNVFSINELKKRKEIELSSEKDAENYIKEIAPLLPEDFKNLSNLKSALANKYIKYLKPLRDKVYAHRENMSLLEVGNLFAKIDDGVIMELAQGANGIYNDIWMAYHNGSKFSLKGRDIPDRKRLDLSTENYLKRYKLDITK